MQRQEFKHIIPVENIRRALVVGFECKEYLMDRTGFVKNVDEDSVDILVSSGLISGKSVNIL